MKISDMETLLEQEMQAVRGGTGGKICECVTAAGAGAGGTQCNCENAANLTGEVSVSCRCSSGATVSGGSLIKPPSLECHVGLN